jgi:hypothetical protein
VSTWQTKVPILNPWAFVGNKEKLRQDIEIPSPLVDSLDRLRDLELVENNPGEKWL